MSPDHTPSRKRLMLLGIGGLSLAALLVASGLAARTRHERAVVAWTETAAVPQVLVFQPQHNVLGDTLRLPAHLEAWSKAPIHARVSGYLKDWTQDIGTHVAAGQVLAHIDSPDLDQQVAQARARMTQQQANARLAQTTAERWQNLLASHSVSRQEADEKTSNAAAAKANAEAAAADYARLSALEDYKTIRAPFAGTITARHTDIGQLIKADNDSDPELFDLADTHKLRLYVPIPQNYASVIRPGLHAQLTVPEHPGQHFSAQLLGDSTAIDPRSGTLLAQFVAANPDGALMPGDYAEATLAIPADTHGVSIPASALIFRAQGTQVAVIDGSRHVHLRSIHIGLDLGERLVIDQGLQATDQVIDNPPDALREGDLVQLADAGGEHAPKA
ncbi:RND family efflux transporter MFP subunit [Pseudomonas protegens]|jgi:RND family efflux transporter MFP subunit|uniref:RND transporter, membrane fusion protein, putative n=1 Tax=Pseudomonas protegens (strain DSM 19095 / LMG 27888 / CFBP 6595 / CHA0) TaxID=1124983 RepID=A0A2C9EL60_PSEPH|nr:efflux RND transporter periplasmic adaptor subunit [Pseudomonas protegens]GED74224.1 RND transporter MFP subunit [Pseudomonas fluorescens]AGL84392.1 RND transporter, membrane fusion protein, putative [Pseudomonas protegens CHA0]APC21071.1 efflux transporter periplasmic adaptor subunit [Pseudomonas protegens]AQT09433.1 RND family efflux transporter MFP subunit [Pseudomonas protegens]MBP5110971.1 efflux RND transporter periplasmic adaptor subunit [Pseudomonas protegens]